MKVSGSYESIVRGVSSQVPQNRRIGQHYEQINLISSPAKGLCRRHGSVRVDEAIVGTYNPANLANTLSDTKDFKQVEFLVDDNRYCLFYRTKAKPSGSESDFAYCISRETGEIIPVSLDVDSLCAALDSGGVSAATSVGRYVFLAGNTISPSVTKTDKWNAAENKRLGVTWVRSGAYSRKFTLKLTVREIATNTLTTFNAEYTTLAASYPELLDTSDIAASDPEYQKKVNDRVNEYNGLVTQWIGLAGADIIASNIALKLKEDLDDLVAASAIPTAVTTSLSNSTVGIQTASGFEIYELKSSDSGDETLTRSVAHTDDKPEDLTAEHFPGKVVKITPTSSSGNPEAQGYYVIATPRSPIFTPGVLTEVTWEETAGELYTTNSVFVLGTIDSGTLYLSGTPAGLAALAPTLDPDDIPTFTENKVGDTLTTPITNFFGKRIDYLGIFQDRLVVGCGSVLTFSRTGDYFNFYRKTVLSIIDDDPLEIFSLGSEDDTIKSSTFYDKNLVLFGRRKQYAINGRAILTPRSPLITVLSSSEGATDAEPQGSGNYVFYSKFRNGISSLHQLQIGAVADSPESYENSQQLQGTYLHGRPVQILTMTSPDRVLLRTDENRNGFFVYEYLDDPSNMQRLYDSWSTWKWDDALGVNLGMTLDGDAGDVWVLTLRHGRGSDDVQRWYAVVEKFTFDVNLSSNPYMDSLTPYVSVDAATTEWMNPNSEFADRFDVAFNNSVDQFLLGQRFETRDNLEEAYPDKLGAAMVGIPCDAYVTPTNPYMRDRNGLPITNVGRLTISRYTVSVSDTAGLEAHVTITTKTGPQDRPVGSWNGRSIGRLPATLGIQPVATGSISVPISRQNDQFTYTLKSKGWLPLTIFEISWVGQSFLNTRRV